MHLSPRERERLDLFLAAELARRRITRGRQLNAPEAIAVLCDEVLELAWDGVTLDEILQRAPGIVRPEQLREGVAELVPHVQVEALFPTGTALIAVDHPFGRPGGDGPGAVRAAAGMIDLNVGRTVHALTVHNTGALPVFVSSHFPFAEVNVALGFDRRAAAGLRLNIAAGTSAGFPPGSRRDVDLIALADTPNSGGAA